MITVSWVYGPIIRAMQSGPADYAVLDATLFSRSRMSELTAMIIGAGALGNEVARQAGMLGLAHVILVDPDCVEARNLPRSFFFWPPEAIGRNKAAAVAAAASRHFPSTRWTARATEVADVPSATIQASHVLFSCVDSDLARFEIAYLAKQAGVMVVDAGLGRDDYSFGRVSVFPASADTACYGCLMGPRKRRALLETWHSTLRSCTEPIPATRSGTSSASTPTMAALVAAMQVEIGLRALLETWDGRLSAARSVEIRLHPKYRLDEFRTDVSTACLFHDIDRTALYPMPVPQSTFGDLLARTGAESVTLEWPICVLARCPACGAEWAPMQRLATLRRRGRCAACGTTSVLEVETLRVITAESRWAATTAEQLGFSAEHRFRLQFGSDPS